MKGIDLDLTTNGHQLLVEQKGPDGAPTVVLLHHGLGSVRAWRGQMPVLAEAGFHVVAYDRWGYGGSASRPKLDLPEFNTDLLDLEALLNQLNIHRAALVGHSDGGSMALYFAAQEPERVSCIVTIAAHIYVEAKMEPGILGVKQAFQSDERFRTGMQYAHGEKYESVFTSWFDGWHRVESLDWDMRPILNKIRCPALIVQGEEDEHATPQHAQDIAKAIPGAQLWILPGAKHMLPQENSMEFNARLIKFLQSSCRGKG